MAEEFANEFPISMAIFMELFCSIHMSVFVLQPLAEFINPEKKTSLFWNFFVIRAVILLVGNFITTFIAILDFLAIFFGAFIVLPVLSGLKKERHNAMAQKKQVNSSLFDARKNAKAAIESELINIHTELEKLGILDEELLKRELYNIFIKYKMHYSNQNFEILIPLCDEKFLEYTKQRMNFIESKKYKEVSENFSLLNAKIIDVYSNNTIQKITTIFNVSCTEYLMNANGKILKGNQYSVKNKKIKVAFRKNISGDKLYRKCPNCGAPIMPYDITCDYCNAVIPNDNDWRISLIEEIEEKVH